jgi:hypothetical protein
MTTNIDCGTSELFYPFKKYLPGVKHLKVSRLSVGYEQWEVHFDLLDKDKKKISIEKIGESNIKELDNLAKLWDEECFEDWLHNVVLSTLSDIQLMLVLENRELSIFLEPRP